MKRRATLLIVVFLLAGTGLFFLLRPRGTARVAAIPALFFLAPADGASLVYVDLAALRDAPFLAQFLALALPSAEDSDYRAFVSATGFDYSRDLDRALLITRPAAAEAPTIAFAEGRFDREKIAAYALRTGIRAKLNGAEFYAVASSRPSKTISFAFLAPGRMVLADAPIPDAAVFAPPAPELPPEQRARLLRVAGAAVIVLARVDASSEQFSLFGFRSRELRKSLRNVRWLVLAARPDGELLKIALEAECASADAARDLARSAETMRLLGRLLLSDARARRQISPPVATLVEAILRDAEFIHQEQRVQARFELSAAMLAAVAALSDASPPARPR